MKTTNPKRTVRGQRSGGHAPNATRELPVELAELQVRGLFGRYDHTVSFPHPAEGTNEPALVILHGQNGVGKTTLLLMLDGLMRLDFDVFRVRPFTSCSLGFTSGDAIEVARLADEGSLVVTFRQRKILLHPRHKGAWRPGQEGAVEEFRQEFFAATADIALQFISTGRSPLRDNTAQTAPWEVLSGAIIHGQEESPESRLEARLHGRAIGDRGSSLASSVRRFILDAQVNYREFFHAEPELFARIFQVIQGATPPTVYDPDELMREAERIAERDRLHARLGLQPDYWNRDQLVGFLNSIGAEKREQWALAALGAYIEGLASRSQERQLLADRLLKFESILNEFFADKRVVVGGREGLRVETSDGSTLAEHQLSSGEFHLLYLMVTALIARRRGTVIAIDEPELSMHISWQRRLISSLVEVASNARPQLVLATHSPDVVAEYRQFLVQLGPDA